MPTMAEVRAQLTGPGRRLRGRHRRRRRRRDEGLQGPVRQPPRRSPRSPRRAATTSRSSSTASAASATASSSAWPTRCRPRSRAHFGRRPRRPGGGAVGEQPRVVRQLLGDGGPGRGPGGLNGWWKSDEILYGLDDSGAKVWSPTGGASSASPTTSTSSPTSRPSTSSTPTRPTSVATPELHRFDELTGRARRRLPRPPRSTKATPRSSSTRAAPPGDPKGAISTHRNMIANLQNTVFSTIATADGRRRRRPADGRRPPRRRPDRGAAHLPAVPRVGLPLEPGGRHARRHASWSSPRAGSSPTKALG